jgi:hypothetical protein
VVVEEGSSRRWEIQEVSTVEETTGGVEDSTAVIRGRM